MITLEDRVNQSIGVEIPAMALADTVDIEVQGKAPVATLGLVALGVLAGAAFAGAGYAAGHYYGHNCGYHCT